MAHRPRLDRIRSHFGGGNDVGDHATTHRRTRVPRAEMYWSEGTRKSTNHCRHHPITSCPSNPRWGVEGGTDISPYIPAPSSIGGWYPVDQPSLSPTCSETVSVLSYPSHYYHPPTNSPFSVQSLREWPLLRNNKLLPPLHPRWWKSIVCRSCRHNASKSWRVQVRYSDPVRRLPILL